MILNDWQRGKIPYFVKPPDSEVSIDLFSTDKCLGKTGFPPDNS